MMQIVSSVRLEYETVGDYTIITSPDMPGLCVAGLDQASAISMVKPTIEALNRMAERTPKLDDKPAYQTTDMGWVKWGPLQK